MNWYIVMAVFGGGMSLAMIIAIIVSLDTEHKRMGVFFALTGTLMLFIFSVGVAGTS